MIQETIKLITTGPNYEPSSGDNLRGMEYDIEHAFESSDTFENVSVKRSDDKNSLFQISLTVSESVENLHDVSGALKEAWDFIQYQYFEASSITLGPDKAAFRFVTIIGKNQFFVTGLAWVKGAAYERLAKNA